MVLLPELLYNVCQSVSNGDSDCSSSCTIFSVVTAVNIHGLLERCGERSGYECIKRVHMLTACLHMYSDDIAFRASL